MHVSINIPDSSGWLRSDSPRIALVSSLVHSKPLKKQLWYTTTQRSNSEEKTRGSTSLIYVTTDQASTVTLGPTSLSALQWTPSSKPFVKAWPSPHTRKKQQQHRSLRMLRWGFRQHPRPCRMNIPPPLLLLQAPLHLNLISLSWISRILMKQWTILGWTWRSTLLWRLIGQLYLSHHSYHCSLC